MTLGVYTSRLFVDYNLISKGMFRSYKISTDKRVMQSLCIGRAFMDCDTVLRTLNWIPDFV